MLVNLFALEYFHVFSGLRVLSARGMLTIVVSVCLCCELEKDPDGFHASLYTLTYTYNREASTNERTNGHRRRRRRRRRRRCNNGASGRRDKLGAGCGGASVLLDAPADRPTQLLRLSLRADRPTHGPAQYGSLHELNAVASAAAAPQRYGQEGCCCWRRRRC